MKEEKKKFLYNLGTIYAILGIGFLGFIVSAHHIIYLQSESSISGCGRRRNKGEVTPDFNICGHISTKEANFSRLKSLYTNRGHFLYV